MDVAARRWQVLNGILHTSIRARRAELEEYVYNALEGTVRHGPFAGVKLSRSVSWSGDIASKLLGVYEKEIYPYLVKESAKAPPKIINIGCAEGFYAIGMALLTPLSEVVAYDISPAAQKECQSSAEQNGVDHRVTVKAFCGTAELASILSGSQGAFVLSDCEGGESDIFSEDFLRQDGRSHNYLIECHDFAVAGVTETLRQRFSKTHKVTSIYSAMQDVNSIDMLKKMSDWDRAILTCEGRPCVMTWLYCEAEACLG